MIGTGARVWIIASIQMVLIIRLFLVYKHDLALNRLIGEANAAMITFPDAAPALPGRSGR